MQGYPLSTDTWSPPWRASSRCTNSSRACTSSPPRATNSACQLRSRFFPRVRARNAVLTLPALARSPTRRMPPQQMHQMHQMQQQPQGNWKDQLNLPVRDERYRTEVRALPTRRPT